MKRGEDPSVIVTVARRPPRLPVLVAPCSCECGCVVEMVLVCGFCGSGMHEVLT